MIQGLVWPESMAILCHQMRDIELRTVTVWFRTNSLHIVASAIWSVQFPYYEETIFFVLLRQRQAVINDGLQMSVGVFLDLNRRLKTMIMKNLMLHDDYFCSMIFLRSFVGFVFVFFLNIFLMFSLSLKSNWEKNVHFFKMLNRRGLTQRLTTL